MGFLAPWFLAGLAAVALPVWLHLLRRHKTTPLPFSSLMFFERRTQSSVRHRRLRYLLLFALRCALLILIALAFAQPFLERQAAGARGSSLTILAIDESFSMRQGNRMERARREALETAARLRPGDRAQVIAFAASARVLSESGGDPGELRAAIQSVNATDSRGSYGALVRALRAIAESSRQPLDVHLFSDMQKSALPPAFADLRLPGGVRLTVHPAAESRAPNWAVESVQAPRRLYDPKKARVQAAIAGLGTERARRRVSLVLGNRTLETKEVEVPAGGRATVEFLSFETQHGSNRGEIRIDSADSLPADDRRLFAIERAEALPVLFVHEARERRALLYFRAALEAAENNAFRLQDAIVEQTAGIAPSKFAFVVLSDVGSLPESFASALRKYVEGGGSLWIALGPATAARHSVPVLGAAIKERLAERGGFETVSHLDAAHPSVRRAGQWEGVRFYQVLRVDSTGARVVARLSDQTPVLLEKRYGEGRVLLFASTFDNISNDFPLRASFVPFVEETAAYLGGLEETARDLLVDSHLPLRTAADRGKAIEVIDPEGRRALSLEAATTAQSMPLVRSGFYEVRRGNGRQETVAVNPDPRESDLDLIPAETLELWRNTGESAAASAQGEGRETKRQSLWRYALLLVLALAVAESAVANRHLPARKEAE